MQADDISRATGCRGYPINVQGGRVGCKDGAGFADTMQIGEQPRLDRHILKHPLDYEIRVVQPLELDVARNAMQMSLHPRITHPTLGTPAGGRITDGPDRTV